MANGVLSGDPRAVAWQRFLDAMEAYDALDHAIAATSGTAKTTAKDEQDLIRAALPGLLSALKAARP